jgi:SpoVK/Ycf46/Vps4 family AAA+-type ATPase
MYGLHLIFSRSAELTKAQWIVAIFLSQTATQPPIPSTIIRAFIHVTAIPILAIFFQVLLHIPQPMGDNMSEIVKIRKSGNDLIISIPMEICENLDLKEGSQVEIESFICSGEAGARIRPIKRK